MAVRQYIGARYVPKFSDHNGGNWDNSYTYEAFEIVKYGNDYYTAKKAVPTGIAITNTEYWILTGNYNGAISSLDSRLTTAEGEIDDIQDDIDFINRGYNKILIIGDSYCTQLNNTLPKQIMQNLGVATTDYYISALGSTGFARVASGKKFLDLLIDCNNHFNNADVTHIIVLGGANDSLESDSDITAAITAFKTYANTNYPNAKILYGFIGATTDPTKIREYARACLCYHKNESTLSKFIYLNNVEYIYHNRAMISDGVHPTEAGYAEGARQIANAIKNGECTVDYFYATPTDEIGPYTRIVFQSIHNGEAMVWSHNYEQISYASGSRPSIPGSGQLREDLKDMTGGLITGAYFEDASDSTAYYMYYDNGSKAMIYPFETYVYDGKLKYRVQKVNPSVEDINNINLLLIPPFKISFNTLYC